MQVTKYNFNPSFPQSTRTTGGWPKPSSLYKNMPLHIKHRIYSRQSIGIRVDQFKTRYNLPLPLEFTVDELPHIFRITYQDWLQYPIESTLSRRDNIPYREIPLIDLQRLYTVGLRGKERVLV